MGSIATARADKNIGQTRRYCSCRFAMLRCVFLSHVPVAPGVAAFDGSTGWLLSWLDAVGAEAAERKIIQSCPKTGVLRKPKVRTIAEGSLHWRRSGALSLQHTRRALGVVMASGGGVLLSMSHLGLCGMWPVVLRGSFCVLGMGGDRLYCAMRASIERLFCI